MWSYLPSLTNLNSKMKRILLLLLTIISSSNIILAQTKGQILLYGTISVNNTKSEWGEKSFWLRGAPGIGYNLSDNWAVGITGFYDMRNTVDSGARALKSKEAAWAAGPFVRYSQPLGDLFFIYGQLDVVYGQPTAGIMRGVAYPKPDMYTISASLTPAIGMDLDKGFNLYFSFGNLIYKYSKTNTTPDAAQQLHLNFGSAFSFGVSKFFGDDGRSNSYRNY